MKLQIKSNRVLMDELRWVLQLDPLKYLNMKTLVVCVM